MPERGEKKKVFNQSDNFDNLLWIETKNWKYMKVCRIFICAEHTNRTLGQMEQIQRYCMNKVRRWALFFCVNMVVTDIIKAR